MAYNKINIQFDQQKILTSSAYGFKPIYALHFGSPAQAMVYQQLNYRAKSKAKATNSELSVRFSYSKLAKMFGYSRRWMVETIKALESKGAIEIIKNGRVNELKFKTLKIDVPETNRNKAMMLIFPELLNKVSLLEAIAIQQIHIRLYKNGPKYWVVRSYQQWQDEVFMYLSIATIKRLFKRLEDNGLIHKQKYEDELGFVNSYRVSYKTVADLLGINFPNSGFHKQYQ